jgi:type III pantothenate kinase
MNFYAIDFGHTNYKIAFIENGNVVSVHTNNYQDKFAFSELNVKIKESECKKILCCNVLSKYIIDKVIGELPFETKNILKFFNSEDCQKYISLAYKKNINRLGADRAINLVGASKKTKTDLVVIDAGTATTIDYLDSAQNHLGGIIVPSKNIIDNIFSEILDFNFSDEEFVDNIFSTNTRSCIENGSAISAYGVINNILDKMFEIKKNIPKIYVTGGNAKHIIDNCNYPIIHVESLLFDGLVVLDA